MRLEEADRIFDEAMVEEMLILGRAAPPEVTDCVIKLAFANGAVIYYEDPDEGA